VVETLTNHSQPLTTRLIVATIKVDSLATSAEVRYLFSCVSANDCSSMTTTTPAHLLDRDCSVGEEEDEGRGHQLRLKVEWRKTWKGMAATEKPWSGGVNRSNEPENITIMWNYTDSTSCRMAIRWSHNHGEICRRPWKGTLSIRHSSSTWGILPSKSKQRSFVLSSS
jgi:hypothetical protein